MRRKRIEIQIKDIQEQSEGKKMEVCPLLHSNPPTSKSSPQLIVGIGLPPTITDAGGTIMKSYKVRRNSDN